MTSSNGPLAGIRVLETGGFTAAYAGKLLAEAGADVVRVVDPGTDQLDGENPFFESGASIQAAWYNLGKRVLQARAADLAELAAGADIYFEETLPLSALDRGALERANPALVHVVVTPMGLTGPRAGWRTNDLVANALSGSASVTGNADSPPISGYGNQTHHTAGMYAAVCSLASLRVAKASGMYQHIDLSAHEALVTCTEQVLMEWFFPNGTWNTAIAPRQGSLHWSNAYEVYPAADGHGVMVTAALRFVDVLLPWLLEDGAAQDLADPEKYPNVVAMIRDLPYVMKVRREWVATKGGEELFFEGQRHHQPFGVVWNIAEAATRSAQAEARAYFQPMDIPGHGSVKCPGRLFRTDVDGPRPALARRAESVPWEPRGRSTGSAARDPARPLEGVRILDFTHVLAGPFGTRVLGDLGADVIKVGTGARSAGANSPEHPYYTMWNRNKRHITVNMGSEEGRALARKLAGSCDVVIENFSAGVLKRWGLDREGLRDANPGVTVIHMGGMGQDGPWKDFVTFAPTIHALTGLTYLTNPPGEHLLGYGFSLTDHLSGLAGALAALEGIAHRERTGEGLAVDLSQYELGLGLMGPAFIDYFANGVNPEPVGNRHPFAMQAPHGIYRCAGEDRWVAIAADSDGEWQRLAALIGGLEADDRFANLEARLTNQDALDAALSEWTAQQAPEAVAELLQAHGITAGVVQNARDLSEDPQLASRGFFGTANAAPWGDYGIDRFPALFNGKRPARYDGVHAVGEDTFDVATDLLGLSDAAVTELLASGALS